MTPEHGSKSEENCNLRAAKAGHSSNICLSSPNAISIAQLADTTGPRQFEMAALLSHIRGRRRQGGAADMYQVSMCMEACLIRR